MTQTVDTGTVPTSTDPVDALRATWREVSRAYATYLAAMVDVGQAEGITPGWETAEIGAALTFTARRADYEYTFAQMLVVRLPVVFAALQSGHLDHHKARVFADYLTDLENAQIHRICTRLVPRAHRWTTGQLAARLLREVQAVDRHYTRRRYQRAVQERGVSGYLTPDGTATITAHGLTPAEAAAAADRLDMLGAALLRAGHPGTIHQIRADLFVRLLDGRYNGFTTYQIITAMLTDTGNGAPPDDPGDGPGGEDPGGGDPDDNGPDDNGPDDNGPGGADVAGEGPTAGSPAVSTEQPDRPAGTENPRPGIEVRIGLATLLGLDDHPAELPGWGPVLAEYARLLVTRQHHAQWIVAITDQNGYLIHSGLVRTRPPPATTGRCRGGTVEIHISAILLADHHPTSRYARTGLRRHIRLRDRTCVAPGCRRPARTADQDHTRARARGGRTERANLGPLCERHHLMKHAAGWELEQPEPGRFIWRSPLGQTYRTRGDPIAPDLPDPVPRSSNPTPDNTMAEGHTDDGPIFPPGMRHPPAPDPAAPDPATAAPDPVDLDDDPPF